jgi:hypothetical protein
MLITMPTTMPTKLDIGIESVARSLAPDVVRIRYTFKDDWEGKPALFVRVLLSDAASKGRRLMKTADRARECISAVILESGVKEFTFYNFRSAGERKTMADLRDWQEWE